MSRLLSQIKIDIRIQLRNKFYTLGIIISIMIGFGLYQLATPSQFPSVVPALLLIVIGGTTMLYVAGIIIFEKDEGTLNATIVSPLTTQEYLWSKIVTLTLLATIESVIMIGGAVLILNNSFEINLPNIGILLFGIITIGVMYTLIGIIVIVRYDRISDFLMPMAAIIIFLQLPFLHFWGVVEHSVFLLIPTSAPTQLMQGGFIPLSTEYWIYGVVYSAFAITGLVKWAISAFNKHIILKGS